MAPTQRHRWFARPDNRSARRQADLLWLATDLARRSFDERYGTVTFGPVVALIAAYEEERNIGDVLKAMPDVRRRPRSIHVGRGGRGQ